MSDLGLDADLTLDIRQALDQSNRLAAALEQATSGQVVRIIADVAGIPGEITGAVDAADTEVVVTGEAADLTGDVTAAIDNADTAVSITGEASDVTASIDGAVDAASPAEVGVTVDPGPIADGIGAGIRDGLAEGPRQAPAAGSQTGGAFATNFSRSVTAAIKALPKVDIGANSTEAQREIASIRDQLLRLDDQTIGVDISGDEAFAEMGRIQERLNAIGGETVSAAVAVDIGSAQASLSQVTSQLDRVDNSVAGVGVAAGEAGDGLGDLDDALGNVNLGLIAASGSGLKLRAIFQALSITGVAVGLFKAAQAASDLGESTSKATVVFGEGIEQVQEFADSSAQAIGLSESAALEATGTFGNLFVALGATKETATDLAPQVVGLAADLASFNNLGVDETLEKLRSGLVGEIEPLRSLGISFGAAEVEAKAMELGLVGANGEITEGAKLQARWALILEQSTTAQGDFARTSSGLANQQRILTAEFQNAVTALGQALLPALLEGVTIARQDLIPAFQQVGEDVLPAVAKAFVSLLPLAGSFANILVALSPAIVSVANAIAGLPPELVTLLGLFAAFRKFGGGDLTQGLVKGFKDLADPTKGPGGFGASLKKSVGDMITANAASVGLSLGLAAIGLAFQEEAEKAAEFRRQVTQIKTSLTTALEPGVNTVDALQAVFADLVKQGDTGANVLAKTGITATEFSAAVAKGGDTTENLARAIGLTADELGILRPFFDRFSQQVDEAAKGQVEAIRASGELSQSYVDTAIATNTVQEATGEGTAAAVDYVAVLGTLTEEQNRLAQQIGVTVDETGQLVTATGPAADAANVLALSLEQVRTRGGDLNLELAGLASAAGNARVAEEDLQTVADTLGVSLDDLKTFVGSVNDAVNSFADDTLSTIPSIGDIIGDLGDDFSPRALLDKLTEATEGIANFSQNLEDLAAFPRVQQIAATNGPLVAAALAKPVQDGNTQVIEDLEAQAAAFDLHYAGLDEELRTTLGPQIADATGLTGQLATEAFGENFHPEEDATVAIHGSITAIENAGPEAAAAGQNFGTASVDGYFETVGRMPGVAVSASEGSIAAINARNFAANLAGVLFGRGIKEPYEIEVNKMPISTGSAADKAVSAVNTRNGFAKIAGAIFGGGFSTGTGKGAAGMTPAAGGAADSAISKVRSKSDSARSAGAAIGGALASGMSAGINSAAAAVGSAAAALVQNAIDKARAKARTGSPSKLFAELGVDMGEGVAVGLDDTTETVASSAVGLIDAAAAAANGTLDVAASALDVARLPSNQFDVAGAGSSSSTTSLIVNVNAGAVVIQSSPGEDTAAFERKARRGADAFLSRITTTRRAIDTGARIGG